MNRHVDEVAALSKAIDTMLDSVTTNGSWNDYDESWAPVITALNVDLLLKAGLHPKENWTIPEKGHEQSLTASFQYLNSEIKENGTFGTDFWDACNLGLIIENHSLHHYLPSYKLLKSHILSVIKQSEIESGDSEWRGPGFIACAINYLDRLGMLTEAEVLTNKLLACQNNDGGWKGIENKSGHPIVPPVWHTSQSIITLFMRGQHQYRENIEKAVDWLKSQQEDNGSWTAVHQYDIYCTSYAMISLIQSGMANKRVIDNGVEYLKGNMSDKGRCPDMGGTVMCSL
ncbi:MAG: terpene cyclase/mutase family protein, partial [Candidatus Peribacteraceae bacterium]|nr:terpene cyclase/mutase family protein [Candidatus Peribacteraceae bacterium]